MKDFLWEIREKVAHLIRFRTIRMAAARHGNISFLNVKLKFSLALKVAEASINTYEKRLRRVRSR